MNLLVNPITKNFVNKFADVTLNPVVKGGKKFIRSIFGKSGADEIIERQLAQNRAYAANALATGKKLELPKKFRQPINLKPADAKYQKAVLNSVQHGIPLHTPVLSQARKKLNCARSLKAQFDALVKRDERGVIISSEAECREILKKLDPEYVRITRASAAREEAARAEIMRLPANHIRRKLSPFSGIGYVSKPYITSRDIVCRYGIRLDNEITSLRYECNRESFLAKY